MLGERIGKLIQDYRGDSLPPLARLPRSLAGPQTPEVFYVGTWGEHRVADLWEVRARAKMSGVPETFVCDWKGEVMERREEWTRWSAPSSGALTKWHVLELDDMTDRARSLCGLEMGIDVLVRAKTFERVARHGPPVGACRACQYELSKSSPHEDDRLDAAAMAMLSLAASKAGEGFRRSADAWKAVAAQYPSFPLR